MANHPKTGTSYLIKQSLLLSLPRRRPVSFLLIGLLLSLFGCATAPKPSSVLASQVSQIEQALRQIEEAYRQKDEERLSFHLNRLSEQASFFKEQVSQDFTAFSDLKIKMNITRVNKTKEDISTMVYWEGEWRTETGSPPLRRASHALFVWSLDAWPKLLEIRGDAPWGIQSVGSLSNG